MPVDAVAVVRDRLLAVAAVTALASTRIYSGTLPQSPAFPAVLVQLVAASEESHLRGPIRLMHTRVQVTSLALTRAQAIALDAAVQGDGISTGLTNWRGTAGSPSLTVVWTEPVSVFEDYLSADLRQYRIMRDYRVHHER